MRERLSDHRAAPDHRLFSIDQKPDRHRRQSVTHQRPQMLAIRRGRFLPLQSEHERLAWPVNISVQNAYARPLCRPRERQIYRDSGLANAALARGHRHDILDLIDRFEVALDGVRADVGFQRYVEFRLDPGSLKMLSERGRKLLVIAADGEPERDSCFES